MDALQKNRLSSYKLIVKVSEDEPETVETIPHFAEGVVELKGIVSEIDEKSVSQNKDLTGITAEKNVHLLDCQNLLFVFAGALYVYGGKKGDKILQGLVSYSKSKINKLDQQDLVKACKAVLVEVRKLPESELTALGLSQRDVTVFDTATNNLDSKKDTRKGAVIDQKSDNNVILQLFEKAHYVKTEILDNLAPQFEWKHPVFFKKYKDASVVHYKHYAKKSETDSKESTDADSKEHTDTASSSEEEV